MRRYEFEVPWLPNPRRRSDRILGEAAGRTSPAFPGFLPVPAVDRSRHLTAIKVPADKITRESTPWSARISARIPCWRNVDIGLKRGLPANQLQTQNMIGTPREFHGKMAGFQFFPNSSE